MKKQYHVRLTREERNHLVTLLFGGTQKVHEIKRAQILLKADDGWTHQQIADAIQVGRATSERIRKRYAEAGLEAALHEKKRNRIYERKNGWGRRGSFDRIVQQYAPSRL